jgi:hypothetical protein
MTGVLVAMGQSSEEASTYQKISKAPPAITKAPHTPLCSLSTMSKPHCAKGQNSGIGWSSAAGAWDLEANHWQASHLRMMSFASSTDVNQ